MHNLESRLPGEISITSDMQRTSLFFFFFDTTVMAESKEELKSLLMKVKEASILAWKNPWTEESGGLKSMGLHD